MTITDTFEVRELIVDNSCIIGNAAPLRFCLTSVTPATTDWIITYPLAGSGLQIYRGDSAGAFLNMDVNGVAMSVGAAATPNANAVLTLTSTTKGFLLPRMTTAQKNTLAGLGPTAGMMVYDTTLNKVCVYTGAAFQTVTSA